MASISTDANGNRKIQFTHLRKRRTVYVGDMTLKATKHVRDNIEALVTAALSLTSPEPKVAEWVGTIPDWLAEKLANVELIVPRESQANQTKLLGPFLTNYLTIRSDVKPLTKLKYETTRRYLVEHFGDSRPLRSITAGCADEFRLKLAERKISEDAEHCVGENTVRKHIAVAKVFFKAAVRKNLIPSNPFDGHKATIQPNPDRFRFVTRSEIEQVIDACPDSQWRLIVALSRFGGLRCPSEHLALKWRHIDWTLGRITVQSPKTEHHAGKAARIIPLFPELRQPLTEAFDPENEYVITRYRDSNANLRTQFERIVRRAGLEPWEKPFQNMRSTRETELAENYPLHVVTAWLGNSEPVARKHYLQVTDEHFARAVKAATQNPTQTGTEIEENQSKRPLRPSEFPADSDQFSSMNRKTVAEAGLEPARSFRNPGF